MSQPSTPSFYSNPSDGGFRTLFRSILGWLMLNEADEASLARSWQCYQHHDPSTLSHWLNGQQASEAHGLVRAVRMRLRQFSLANDPLTTWVPSSLDRRRILTIP